MSTTLQAFLTGQRYMNVLVYPVAVASTGVATPGTATGDLAASMVFDEFEIQRGNGLVEISATNSAFENYIPTKGTFDATLSEIRKATGESLIETLIAAGNYCKIVVNTSADGSTVGQTYAVLAVMDTTSVRTDPGKNTISVSVKPVGIAPYSGSSTVPF